MYKISSNTLLSRLTPHVNGITGHHQCGFRHNRSTTDHTLCIRHTLETKWEWKGELFLASPLLLNHCRCRGLLLHLITLNDTHKHSVGLLWMSDQPVAETSTWQHTTLTTDIHAPAGFEPSIPASDWPQSHALDRAATGIGSKGRYVTYLYATRKPMIRLWERFFFTIFSLNLL
jgi:hypothetical protein